MPDFNTDAMGLPGVQHLFKAWMSGIIVFVFLLMAVELLLRTSEWWATRHTDKPRKLLPDNAIVNMLTTSVYDLTLRGVGYGAMFVVALWGYNHSHWRIPLNWWTLPAYILAAEFWSYFFHRLMHEVRLFWADHSVHHSAPEFDFTTAQRFHLFEWVPKVIVMLPLAMLGFHPAVLFVFTALAGIQLICHTARFGRWGWWDRHFVSPTIHGVHHSRNPIYMDRNLGGALNIWDRLFGTFQMATDEKMVFGITHTVGSTNLIKVLFWEYTFLWRDFIHAPTLKDRLIVLFGRPGETFEAPAHAADKAPSSAPAVLPAFGSA
jgi:sterol desaturase/sphingolipid hydroxylase (fatty acid hydroxylase superfamily)